MKTALIFGSSGLIGNNLVKIILQNNKYDQIKLFVRSEKENNNPKLEIIKTDFNNLEKHKNSIVGDDCFFCIGTTRKNTPNKNEYIKVEYNLPVAVAKMAKSNSVNHFRTFFMSKFFIFIHSDNLISNIIACLQPG